MNDFVQVNVAEFRGGGAREVQQVVDDLRGAEALAGDLLQQGGLFFIALELLGEHLRVAGDDGQRRVDFMRHARGHEADGRQFFGLRELGFELHAVSDVVEDDETADDVEAPRDQRRDGDVGDAIVTGTRLHAELVEVVDAGAGARAIELFDESGGEDVSQLAAQGF